MWWQAPGWTQGRLVAPRGLLAGTLAGVMSKARRANAVAAKEAEGAHTDRQAPACQAVRAKGRHPFRHRQGAPGAGDYRGPTPRGHPAFTHRPCARTVPACSAQSGSFRHAIAAPFLHRWPRPPGGCPATERADPRLGCIGAGLTHCAWQGVTPAAGRPRHHARLLGRPRGSGWRQPVQAQSWRCHPAGIECFAVRQTRRKKAPEIRRISFGLIGRFAGRARSRQGIRSA